MLIQKVRTATHSLHEALDQSLVPYIEAIETTKEYAALLCLFYGFFKPVYDSIDASIDTVYLPDYSSRRKPQLILRDLEELGTTYDSHLCRHLPKITDNVTAFGALYVLEGSTLGGVMIKKMVAGRLQTDKGLSFFSGYGRHTREQWNVFINALNNLNNNKEQDEAVIQTAAITFTFFKEWLQAANLPLARQSRH